MALEIVTFKSYQKNTLKGFFTVRLTQIGLELKDSSLHEKNGKRWIALPAKPYKKDDDSQGWSYIVKFYDKARGEQFEKAVLEALDKYNGNK